MGRKRMNPVGSPTPPVNQPSTAPAKVAGNLPEPLAAAKAAGDALAAAKAAFETATGKVAVFKYATGEEVERAAAFLLDRQVPLRGLAYYNREHVKHVLSAFYDYYCRHNSGGKLIDPDTIGLAFDQVAHDEGWHAALSTTIRAHCLVLDKPDAVYFLQKILEKYRIRSLGVPASLVRFCREKECSLLPSLWSVKAVTAEDVAKDLEVFARTNLETALEVACQLTEHDQSLSKLDLSRLLTSGRDDSYRRRHLDPAAHHLFKILKANPGMPGHDAAAAVLADKVLASDDMELLISFARHFRTIRPAEVRAALVKALSGPSVDELVDAVIDRGYPPYTMRRMMMMMPPPWMFFQTGPFG